MAFDYGEDGSDSLRRRKLRLAFPSMGKETGCGQDGAGRSSQPTIMKI
jgi:hypothetical protein